MAVRIFHDPGHGGANLGCQRGGVVEKDLTLSISRDLEAYLRLWPYIEQIQSRDNDETRSYSRRAKQAKHWRPDLVLCHHVDAITDDETGRDLTRFSGSRCYVLEGDTTAMAVATQMHKAMPYGLEARSLLPKIARPAPHWTQRTYNVLSAYGALGLDGVILIEWGFLTNSYDRAALTDLNNRPAMCSVVMNGITRYLQHKHLATEG